MHRYELTRSEQQQYNEIIDRIQTDGGLFRTDADGLLITDSGGNAVPLDHIILRGRRFLVDHRGRLWRFFAEGSPKDPQAPDKGGAPWRNNRVEMWNGRWRKVTGADGKTTYAKVLTARPIDKRINGRPEMSQIDWYIESKGHKHPHDEPNAPSEFERKQLDGQGSTSRDAVFAKKAADSEEVSENAGKDEKPGHRNAVGSDRKGRRHGA